MFQPTMRKLAITCLLVLLLTPLLALNGDWLWSQPADGSIRLEAPPFFNTAQAQGTTFADSEAGIAAYFNAGQQITLSNTALQSLYRSPVTPTGGYLLGSARVSENNNDLNYDANDDAKLYISQDGWVMAYYHRTAPTSKIFDWLNWDGGGNLPTKLAQVLKDAATKIGVQQPTPTYYHFAFPNANRMMLIADDYRFAANVDTNSFNVTPPNAAGFEYFEWSWSLGSLITGSGTLTYFLNDTQIAQTTNGVTKQDIFSSPQPLIGQTNIITIKNSLLCCGVRGVSGLAIVYKVP